jgi:hypothetical protein
VDVQFSVARAEKKLIVILHFFDQFDKERTRQVTASVTSDAPTSGK